MKNYEYLKENTRYSVLFGMDFMLNLTMCSAWFYLHKWIHDSIWLSLHIKHKLKTRSLDYRLEIFRKSSDGLLSFLE